MKPPSNLLAVVFAWTIAVLLGLGLARFLIESGAPWQFGAGVGMVTAAGLVLVMAAKRR